MNHCSSQPPPRAYTSITARVVLRGTATLPCAVCPLPRIHQPASLVVADTGTTTSSCGAAGCARSAW
nr:hypothetical protein [Rugosimonospora africana]